MEVIYKAHTDEVEQKTYLNYYLRLDNGNEIAIKPSFKVDYPKLRIIAKKGE